jgi:trehalose 6-phosphate phosphatase
VIDLARDSTTAAFAGDDAGDLPAFDALRALVRRGALRHAVTIGVASAEGPAEVRDADVVVDGPRGLADLLDALADEISARG